MRPINRRQPIMRCTLALVVALAVALVVAHPLSAQSAAPAVTSAPTADAWRQETARQWRAIHDKILEMARDTVYPESKYGMRPHPDARPMIGELRHVTLGLEYLTAAMKGQRYDWAANEAAADAKPMTRESVVRDMEAAIAESYPLVDAQATPGVLMMLEHQGEHYGKLVSAYRSAGIVPPTSRPKPRS